MDRPLTTHQDWYGAHHRVDRGNGNHTMVLDQVPSAKETLADAVATSSRGSNRSTSSCAPVRTGRDGRPGRPIANPNICDEGFRPYRRLAVRVLARAVLDVMDPAGSATDRNSARAFLTGSTMLRYWCHVAALDPDCIADCVTRFTAQSASVPQHLQAVARLRLSDIP